MKILGIGNAIVDVLCKVSDEFLDDCRQSNDGSGGPFMKSNRESTKNHPIEKVGKELRSKMKFLNSEKLVDKEKN